MTTKYVSYRRVSSDKQGRSGLGLRAQEEAVSRYVSQTAGTLLRDFVEVESGKVNERPELEAAIAFSNRSGAVLLVAKLDRLSRNVAFLATLMETNVKFVAVDNPHATSFTVHIMAAVAQWEREAISKRTKEAMQAAKARGATFGSARDGHWYGREEKRRAGAALGGERAAIVHIRKANAAYKDVAPHVIKLRLNGLSFRKIAEKLNEEGIPTRRGKQWKAATVRLVVRRFGDALKLNVIEDGVMQHNKL